MLPLNLQGLSPTPSPWWLPLWLAAFATMCVVAIFGVVLQVVAWRRFRNGHPAAAGRGLVLHRCNVPTWATTASDLEGVGGWRAANATILLAPYALWVARSRGSWAVPWCGRAVIARHQACIDARVPVGFVMFVGGWIVMAILMTVLLVAVRAPWLALAAATAATTGAWCYWRNLRRERGAAQQYLTAVARAVAHRDATPVAADASRRE